MTFFYRGTTSVRVIKGTKNIVQQYNERALFVWRLKRKKESIMWDVDISIACPPKRAGPNWEMVGENDAISHSIMSKLCPLVEGTKTEIGLIVERRVHNDYEKEKTQIIRYRPISLMLLRFSFSAKNSRFVPFHKH